MKEWHVKMGEWHVSGSPFPSQPYLHLRVLAQHLRARLRLYPRKSIKVAMEFIAG